MPLITQVSPSKQDNELSYKYLVRIIPPDKKSNAKTLEWHDVSEVFSSPAALRMKLMDSFGEKIPSTCDFTVGYITKRGNSKRWIEQSADLNSMYKQFERGDTITFFCDGKPEKLSEKRKRKSTAEHMPESAHDDHELKVKKVALDLGARHGDKYDDNQLKLWARMMVNKQHDDMDNPPNIPLITGGIKRHARKESLTEVISGAATAFAKALASQRGTSPLKPSQACAISSNTGVSPSSKARLSGQYIEQLKSLQELRESGVLSDDEFQEQKLFALQNIRRLNRAGAN